MGKAGKWLRSFLTGKKEKEKEKCVSNHNSATLENPTTPISIPPSTPKEKRRWSFRRSSATAAAASSKEMNSAEQTATAQSAVLQATLDSENDLKKHSMTMVAADAAVAAAQAAATVIRLTAAAATNGGNSANEDAAAIKIQSIFRCYLARKALRALRGLVKLQALVRGHLVRKQATATLRCMQALVTVQARARAQRIGRAEESKFINQRQSIHRKFTQENRFRHTNFENDRDMEENIKIVEMDLGEPKGITKGRNNYTYNPRTEEAGHRFSAHYTSNCAFPKQENCRISPELSALTEMSPRICSGHFEDYFFSTTESSPQYYSAISNPDPSRVLFPFPRPDYADSLSYDHPFHPNYMANTESSRAKVRSQSAPKQRPDSVERQPSRRRASMEGRNIPRVVRMQRSSSHVGSTAHNLQYPWSLKLDRSAVSLKDSECGSTSTVLTNTNYCRSLVGFDVNGKGC